MQIAIKNYIPNTLTLINLFSGCVAVVFAFMGRLDLIIYLSIISLFADFTDGLVARLLNVKSEIGADLDSLADMVSFGFVPGLILFLLIDGKMGNKMMDLNEVNITALFGFTVTIFSALRLAIFNNDENQSSDFVGLATPASTVFVIGLLYIDKLNITELRPLNIALISIIVSLLLVSKIKMFSFKVTSYSFKDAYWQYSFIALSIICLFWFKIAGFSLIVILYVLLNILKNILEKKNII